MISHRLQQLHDAGQSVWLDYIDRTMLRSGDLERRIREDALMGMTSNPTIFEKALAEGHAYDEQILASTEDRSAWALFEALATEDVRLACDAFRGVYDRTNGADGYVSIEVSPHLATDADGTLEEAERLWRTIDRPNVMIKVPGTIEGAHAVRRLIADGINVNVTLLFSLAAHERVIDAYLDGLEARATAGQPLDHVASVASFFVSRVDTEIDRRLDEMSQRDGADAARLSQLKGKAAIANAKLAYRLCQRRFAGPRWDALRARGARPQRPLWASTSTKNPAYRDVIYVEELIGPDTVNTMPPATLVAFRDHGETRRTVDANVDQAARDLADLEKAGISLDEVTDKLLREGLASFQKSFDTLIAGLERKTRVLGKQLVSR
jgi:transaldolase